MNPERTGKFIAELRKESRLTQKELAEKLGVTDKAVSKWETGRCYPDIEILGTLARLFGVTVNDLLSGEKTDAVNREEAADSNILSLMKRFESINRKWRRIFLCVIVAIFVVFGAVFFVGHLPVDFDAGACSGGFSEHIYSKYGEHLAREYLEPYPEEELVFYEISDTARVEWTGRIIFIEFTLTYQLSEGEKTEKTLLFVGERYWIEKYKWNRL